jgi:predicted kinase
MTDPYETAGKLAASADYGLIIMRGLPASGKTTFAHGFVTARAVTGKQAFRVGRDDIRNLLCLATSPREKCLGTREQEDIITGLEKTMIRAMFAAGAHWVVEDSTNLHPASITRLESLAEDLDIPATVITLDVPVEECVARDVLRENPCGEDVIRGMAFAMGRRAR